MRLPFFCIVVLCVTTYATGDDSISTGKGIFLTEPQDQLVPLESTATVSFQCEAQVENPIYEWVKDGVDVDSANKRYEIFKGSLSIKTPQKEDAGSYQCLVLSANGDRIVSNYGVLKFAYISQFVDVVASETIKKTQGHGFAIPCENADYYPKNSVAFYWERKDDFDIIKPPGNTELYVSQKTGSLYFSNPQLEDSDKYSCRIRSAWSVNDEHKTVKSSTNNIVIVERSTANLAPEFLLKPYGVTYGVLGGIKLLECFAGGNPTPEITWSRLEGLPIGHTITPSQQLLLQNITSDMTGTYTCTATNSEGTVQASGQLHMQYKPQWTDEIVSLSVDETLDTNIHCSASAEPYAQYKWLKDGAPVQEGHRIRIVSDKEGSFLQIMEANMSDQAIYQCIATNELGSIFSSAKLTVNSYPPQFNPGSPDIIEVKIGSTANLTCDVSAAPPPNVTWYDGEYEIQFVDNYMLDDGKHLLIKDVTLGDEGEYTCNATNVLNPVGVTRDILLKVFEPNVITQPPKNLTVHAGGNTELNCGATSDPNLELNWVWRQNGDVVAEYGTHYVTNGDTLMLKSVTSAQSGTYECCANTKVSTACASSIVMVIGPPEPPTDVIQTTESSVTAHITWSIPEDNGAPITNYLVYGKNEFESELKLLSTSPNYLNQTYCDALNLLPYNQYQFSVVAINMNGMSSFSEMSELGRYTTPAAPVVAPSNVGNGEGKLGELVITWEPLQPEYYGSDREGVLYEIAYQKYVDTSTGLLGEVQWITDIKRGYQSSEITITVSVDEIYERYEAKVRAVNDLGEGPYSETVSVYTAEIAPNEAPKDFKVTQKEAYWADVAWEPVAHSTGYTRLYYVRICDVMADEICENQQQWETKDEKPKIHLIDLKANNVYSISVAAANSAGIGPYSTWWEFTTNQPPPKNPPQNFKITFHKQKVHAQWDPIQVEPFEAKIKGYVIQYWYINETSENAKEVYTQDTSFDFELPNQADYDLWVRSYSDGGFGTPSATISISGDPGTTLKYYGGKANTLHQGKTIFVSISLLLGVLYSLH